MPDVIAQLIQIVAEHLRDDPELAHCELIAQVERAIAANHQLDRVLRENPEMLQTNQDEAAGFQTVVQGGTVYIGGTQHVSLDPEKFKATLVGVFQELQKTFDIPPVSEDLNSMQQQHRRLEERRDGLQDEWGLRISKLKQLRSAAVIETSAAVKFQLEQQIQAEEIQRIQLEIELVQIEKTLRNVNTLQQLPTLDSEEESDYRHDIFISLSGFKESDDITVGWVKDCFLPILKQALEHHLGFPPSIYLPSSASSHQEYNFSAISQELAYSKCLIPIWRPSYFYDSDYHTHCYIMQKREKQLELLPGSLIWPVIASDGNNIPQDFSMIKYIDCYKYVKTKRMLEQSDTLLNSLHDELFSWAEAVANAINSAPQCNQKWISESNINVSKKYSRPKSQRPKM
jgi:hypothetical protein